MLILTNRAVSPHIGSYLDTAFFSASPWTLVYRAPEPDFRLTWFDRRGAELGRVGTPARFTGLALSANGDRALVPTHAPEGTVNQDLWLFDLARSAAPQRMTFEPTIERSPLWTTDNQFVFGSHGGPSGVYRQSVGGGPHLLFKSGVLNRSSRDPDRFTRGVCSRAPVLCASPRAARITAPSPRPCRRPRPPTGGSLFF